MEIVRRSGHKTLRVVIADSAPDEEIRQFLTQLNDIAVNFEQAQGRLYALDVRPEADAE